MLSVGLCMADREHLLCKIGTKPSNNEILRRIAFDYKNLKLVILKSFRNVSESRYMYNIIYDG